MCPTECKTVLMKTPFHFYRRVLDGDDQGQSCKFDNGDVNPKCNVGALSCLQLLVNGDTNPEKSNSQECIRHPVVRQLVRRKWDLFAHKQIWTQFAFYILFLVLMSCAFFLAAKETETDVYQDGVDIFRGICEILTILFCLFYAVSELDQVIKEKGMYFKDKFNILDILGLVLVFVLIPLRYCGKKDIELSVAAAAYFINFTRVFKFFPAHREIGVYSKTFAQILYVDIKKFAVVYIVVMLAFTGGLYLVLYASKSTLGLGFWAVLLRQLRALAEGNPFEDSYDGVHAAVVVLVLLNMFAIIVVMSNILIGQLSFRYEKAMEDASVQYDLDRAKIVTRLETGMFGLWNSRDKHYTDGDYVAEGDMEQELLDEWVKSQKSEDEKRETYRSMLSNRILKRKEE